MPTGSMAFKMRDQQSKERAEIKIFSVKIKTKTTCHIFRLQYKRYLFIHVKSFSANCKKNDEAISLSNFCLKPIGLCVEKHRNSMLYITAMNQTVGYLTGSICSLETRLIG